MLHALRDRKFPVSTFGFSSDNNVDTIKDIEPLYLAMSRARVKCTVILIFDHDLNDIRRLLDKLSDSVQIIKHP